MNGCNMHESSISIETLIIGAIGVFVSIIAFFLKHKIENVEKSSDKINEILLEMRSMSKDLHSVSREWDSAKSKVDEIPFMNKRVDAAWKRLDEFQVWQRTMLEGKCARGDIHDKKTKEHDAIIQGLRERSHELANWITAIRLEMERHGSKFATNWSLKKIETPEE